MAFKDLIRKAVPTWAKKSLSLSSISSFFYSNNSSFSFAKSSFELKGLYLKNCPLFTAIDIRAEAFASIPIILFDKKKQEIVPDHPFLDLMNNPNPFTSSKLFKKEFASYYDITGNSYIKQIGPINKPPLELMNVQGDNINIIASELDGFPQEYNFSSTSGSPILFFRDDKFRFVTKTENNELIHFRDFNPNYGLNNLEGCSPLQSCEIEVKQYIEASEYNWSSFENQGMPSMLISNKGEGWTPEESDAVAESLKIFKGQDNAGREMGLINGNIEVKDLSTSAKDMDYANLKLQTAAAIFNAYKIPLPLVSQEHMTLSNFDSSRVFLYDNATLPFAKKAFSFFQEKILSRFPDSENLEVIFDEAEIPALAMRKIENAKKLRETGLLTINENRAKLGLESIGEEGDIIYQPTNLIPVGVDQFTEDNRKVPARKKEVSSTEKEHFRQIMGNKKDSSGSLYTPEKIEEMLKEYVSS